ncbi:MAG TPA: hypothetical protein VF461_17120 [Gemmatimonadaceae bacterium]
MEFTTVPDVDSLRPSDLRMTFRRAPTTYFYEEVATDTTDADGRANAHLRFGTLVGDARVIVRCPALGLSDTIHFNVRPGTAALVAMAVGDTIVSPGAGYSIGAYPTDRYRNRAAGTVTYMPAVNVASVDAAGLVTAGTAIGKGRVVVRLTAKAVDTARFTVLPRVHAAGFLWPWDQNGKIVSANLDGSGWKVLTGATGPAYPSASPTRSEVAYHQGEVSMYAIYIVDSTGARRRLVDSNVVRDVVYPRFSADGQRVYFAGRAPGAPTSAIWRINRDGTGLERLVDVSKLNDGNDGAQVGVSPDERRIVFNDSLGVVVYTISTGTRTVIGSNGTQATFSPDGQRIAYTNATALVITNVDGTLLESIPFRGAGADGLAWLPDSRWLLLRTIDGATLLDTATGEQVPIRQFAELHQISIGD